MPRKNLILLSVGVVGILVLGFATVTNDTAGVRNFVTLGSDDSATPESISADAISVSDYAQQEANSVGEFAQEVLKHSMDNLRNQTVQQSHEIAEETKIFIHQMATAAKDAIRQIAKGADQKANVRAQSSPGGLGPAIMRQINDEMKMETAQMKAGEAWARAFDPNMQASANTNHGPMAKNQNSGQVSQVTQEIEPALVGYEIGKGMYGYYAQGQLPAKGQQPEQHQQVERREQPEQRQIPDWQQIASQWAGPWTAQHQARYYVQGGVVAPTQQSQQPQQPEQPEQTQTVEKPEKKEKKKKHEQPEQPEQPQWSWPWSSSQPSKDSHNDASKSSGNATSTTEEIYNAAKEAIEKIAKEAEQALGATSSK